MSTETAKAKLAKYDIKLAIDGSTSMEEPVSTSDKRTRWAAVEESTIGLARHAAAIDDDGISVCVFASKIKKEYENVDDGVDKVKAIFAENSPNGSTGTHVVVKHYGDEYLAAKKKGEAKPVMLVVITDGQPDDEAALRKEIANLSTHLDDKEEFRLLFIQVGDNKHASDFLKGLDEEIKGAKFDLVHSVPFDQTEGKTWESILEESLEEA